MSAPASTRMLDDRRTVLVRLAAAWRTTDRGRMHEALASLRRIRDGSYGYCVRCGLKIPDGEMSRAPDRARCAECS